VAHTGLQHINRYGVCGEIRGVCGENRGVCGENRGGGMKREVVVVKREAGVVKKVTFSLHSSSPPRSVPTLPVALREAADVANKS
jgi:hypothetical protein